MRVTPIITDFSIPTGITVGGLRGWAVSVDLDPHVWARQKRQHWRWSHLQIREWCIGPLFVKHVTTS